MAVMDDTERQNATDTAMREWSRRFEAAHGTMSKFDIRAAINAVDDWIEDAKAGAPPATSYNNALPEPAKTQLTASAKAELLVFVTSRRWNLGLY